MITHRSELLSSWTFSIVLCKTKIKITTFRKRVLVSYSGKNRGEGLWVMNPPPPFLPDYERRTRFRNVILIFVLHRMMEKVQKLNNSEYKPTSESFSIYTPVSLAATCLLIFPPLPPGVICKSTYYFLSVFVHLLLLVVTQRGGAGN